MRNRIGASLRPARLASLLITLACVYACTKAEQPAAIAVTTPQPAAAEDCGCKLPWRAYPRPVTPEVLQLFEAAHAVDEASFNRLIAQVSDVQEFAVQGETLAQALLWPAKSLTEPAVRDGQRRPAWQMSAQEKARLRAAHAATLPARQRMLTLALAQGASLKDTTYEHRRPPLQLAMVFGSPEIVKLLLQHGADPNQVDTDRGLTPTEFALDHEYFVRMTYLPELVEPPARTQMLLMLLAAGAQRPYLRVDQAEREPGETPLPGYAADFLLWPALAELTEGAEVMAAMARTGTLPAFDAESAGLTVLGHAARAGNVEGVRWLLQHAPRTLPLIDHGEPEGAVRDVWLDAAVWALYPEEDTPQSRQRSDAILGSLLKPGMPWGQQQTLADDTRNPLVQRNNLTGPQGGSSLLHHLAATGRADWLQRAVAMGAPVDGVRQGSGIGMVDTPLATAVRHRQLNIVRQLLALQASPLAGEEPGNNPIYLALRDDPVHRDDTPGQRAAATAEVRRAVLRAMLAALTPVQKQQLDARQPGPVAFALEGYGDAPDSVMVRMLLEAGFSTATVGGRALHEAMASLDLGLLGVLLDRGVPVPAGADGADLLIDAMVRGRMDVVERLLRAGAPPNQVGSAGSSAVRAAIALGSLPLLDLLLAQGGQIDTQARSDGPQARSSTLDLALYAADLPLARRVAAAWGGDLTRACPRADARLLAVVLNPDDDQWHEWLALGLGRRNQACATPDLAERLMQAALAASDQRVLGWMLMRLATRLRDLPQPTPQQVAALVAQARQQQRPDVLQVLQQAGLAAAQAGPPAAKATRAEAASPAAKPSPHLVGHYYLEGLREVGSEIVLRGDGRFDYGLAYGAVDEAARGSWGLRGQWLELRTQRTPTPEGWQPYVLAQAGPEPGDEPDGARVQVQYQERSVRGVTVQAVGCDAPLRAHGVTDAQGSFRLPAVGPWCHVVLQHPQVNGGQAYVQALPASGGVPAARQYLFDVIPERPAGEMDFNVDLRVVGKDLVLDRDGRAMRYVRH